MDFTTRSPLALTDEGRAARYRGDPIAANPYPEDTPEHAVWKRAWRQPDEILGDDTPDTHPKELRP